MESNKQIDYDTLEWFDCKNNFPPISIDLYVDSEHGYGIGRLGKRVKDGSIIWTVHLDSGHVYLVYAFYKVKRWAYMPKDEKTNTKLKHELMLNKDRSWVPCYLKSEADEVITELKENHKKDVELLLIEIAELQKQVHDYAQGLYVIQARAEKEARHDKYKRCLAMYRYCSIKALYELDFKGNNVEWKWYSKWMHKWFKLAEKFKEAK